MTEKVFSYTSTSSGKILYIRIIQDQSSGDWHIYYSGKKLYKRFSDAALSSGIKFKVAMKANKLNDSNSIFKLKAVSLGVDPKFIFTLNGVPLEGSEKGIIQFTKNVGTLCSTMDRIKKILETFIAIAIFSILIGGAYYFASAFFGLFITNRDYYDEHVIQNFLNIPGLAYHQSEDPEIDGNLLIVDKTRSRLDQYYWRIPEATESLPQNPEEIDYVLWVECKEKIVGRYTDGDNAFQEFCNLTLIDLYNNEIIDKKNITGPYPPSSKRENNKLGGKGGHPISKIDHYVKSLTTEPVD